MYDANKIAQYFLTLQSPEVGDVITNLKLQKLLYYAQGLYVAKYDTPLFQEKLEAWDYGPVVSTVYHNYKVFGSNGIFIPDNITLKLPESIRKFLADVYLSIGQYSALKLMHMTHEEAPWQSARHTIEKVITVPSIQSFFKESDLLKELFSKSKRDKLEQAAELLYADYEEGENLTFMVKLDGEDFYED